MRRQREENTKNEPEIIDLISSDDEDCHQQPTEETTKTSIAVATNKPISLNPRTLQILNQVAAEVYSNSKRLSKPGAKLQAPLFYEQRLFSAEQDLIKHNIQVHLGSQVITDRASVFISFAAVGINNENNDLSHKISIFEKYVRTLISFVSVSPAHGFMYVSKCFGKNSSNDGKEDNSQGPLVITKSGDDGEEFADEHLEKMLGTFLSDMRREGKSVNSTMLLERGVAVAVSRWFGGVLLGPDRFKHIKNNASNALRELLLEL